MCVFALHIVYSSANMSNGPAQISDLGVLETSAMTHTEHQSTDTIPRINV